MSVLSYSFLFLILKTHLGGKNGLKWKGMKKILLEYSSIPLFGSLRLRLGVHKGGEWNGME